MALDRARHDDRCNGVPAPGAPDRRAALARLLAAGVVRHLRARRAASVFSDGGSGNLPDSDEAALDPAPDSRLSVHDG